MVVAFKRQLLREDRDAHEPLHEEQPRTLLAGWW